MADEGRRERGALLHRDDLMWERRYYFLKSFQETVPLAISELIEDIYPLYQEARGGLEDGDVAIVQLSHEEGIIQTGATFVPFTPFASYRHLYEAMVTQQAGVNLDACLELSKALLSWAHKYRISPEYWSSSRIWVFNSLMFALGSFHSGRDEALPFGFSMFADVHKAALSVTFPPVIGLEWELTEETKAKFKNRAMLEAKKLIEATVDEALEKGTELYKPSGFKAYERPRSLERDMRWLVAYQCLKKDEVAISGEYPHKKYLKKTNRKEKVGGDAVETAIENRAKDIGLILRKEKES